MTASADAPHDPRGSRTDELVASILERRVRTTLRRVSVAMASFSFTIAALGLVLNLTGTLRDLTLPFVCVGLLGLWCVIIVVAVDRAQIGAAGYRRLLLPIYLVPTVLLLVFQWRSPHGASSFMFGPSVFGYFLALVHSASQFRRRLTVAVTGLSVLGYLGVYQLFAHTELQTSLAPVNQIDPILAQGLITWPFFVMRALVMIVAGWMLCHIIEVAYEVITEVANVIAQFGMVVDPRVRDLMLNGQVATEGEERDLTVVFADIRGFTTLAQQWAPPRLLALMKEYFDLMGHPIRTEEGTVIEYIGDEIMTVFGAPVAQHDHAVRAGRLALEMQRVLAEQRPRWESRGYPRIEIGVGLNAGPMLVGTIGSSERQKYGVLGDNVNLGSRVQRLTRDYNVGIIATDAWYARSEGAFHVRELDQVPIKGREGTVTLLEVLGTTDAPLEPQRQATVESWNRALAAYRANDFTVARRALDACLRLSPDDGPARRLVELLP